MKNELYPKFHYGAKIRVRNGFYRGTKGVVTRCYESINEDTGVKSYSYWVDFGGLFSWFFDDGQLIQEEDMELR